ncbi:hypothetical protein MZH31_26220, partial [Escherichia coli]|nr:hypothetical protein [Escherichia coli]
MPLPLPAYDCNGRSVVIWLNPLTTDDGNGHPQRFS